MTENKLIFDSIPFNGFVSNIDHSFCSPWKINIKNQSKIVNDIILHICGGIKDEKVKNYFLIGPDGTGKSFLLKELDNFLKFRSEKVLFLNPENFGKIKRKFFNNQTMLNYKYIIIDDWDNIKISDRNYIEKVIRDNSMYLIASSNKDSLKQIDRFSKDTKVYKTQSLSILETYHYIGDSVAVSYALSLSKNTKIFSFLSIFVIYVLSAGKLFYINNISTFCLDLLVKSKKDKVSVWYVLKYVRKNFATLHNTFKLFIKVVICFLFCSLVFFMIKEIYLRINKAEFERIKEEIELQNLKYTL